MVTIVPTILAKDSQEFEERLHKVWGITKRVQVDIMDGRLVENKTVEPEVISEIDTIVEFDAHLMVEKPEEWVERCVASGFSGVYGQVEKMKDPVKFIADAQFAGLRVGLAYDIETPIEGLEKYIDDLDGVLLLSVPMGASGQKFEEKVLEKIKQVRKISKTVKIIVDGGMNVENIKKCFAAEWAEEMSEDELDRSFAKMEFAVNSELYESENVEKKLERLENLQD